MDERGGRARRADPFGLVALAGAGSLTAHEVGYALAGSDGQVEHGHLTLLAPLVVVSLCLAGWLAAVRVLRAGGGTPPTWQHLALAQTAVYVLLEFGERVLAGSLGTIASPPVVAGLVLQPLVAFVAVLLLRVGERAVLAVFGVRRPLPRRTGLPRGAVPVVEVLAVRRGGSVRLRGPPSV
ncbi:MAG: hypothetical protein AAGG08_10095 [Actinomycetota bacterium]